MRQYRLQPLRHIFRTRGATSASPMSGQPLHKGFARMMDPDLDDVT
jgi:hypothetical protein